MAKFIFVTAVWSLHWKRYCCIDRFITKIPGFKVVNQNLTHISMWIGTMNPTSMEVYVMVQRLILTWVIMNALPASLQTETAILPPDEYDSIIKRAARRLSRRNSSGGSHVTTGSVKAYDRCYS